jgi:hypothetical protein
VKHPSRKFKLTVIIITSLFIITAATAALFLYLYPKDKLLNILISEVEHSLKRKIIVTGIDYSIRGIILRDLTIYDGETPEDPVLTSADKASIRFSLFSLFYKRLSISTIAIDDLKINIIYSDGLSNIERLLEDIKGRGKTPLTTEISRITLNNARINLGEAPDVLKPLSGGYIVNGTVDISEKGRISLSDSEITLPKKRGIISGNISISTDTPNLEISGSVKLNNCSILWTYEWGEDVQLPFISYSGMVKNLSITKNIVQGYVSGSSQMRGNKTLHAKGFCKVDIPGKMVYLSNVSGSLQSSKVTIKELIFSFGGKIIRSNFTPMQVYLSDLSPYLPSIPKDSYGYVTGNLRFADNRYNGDIEFTNAGYNKAENLISDINGSIVLENNIFKKENIPLLIHEQPFRLSIASTDGELNRFFINLKAQRFAIKQSGDKKKLPDLNVTIPFEVLGNIDIDDLSIDDIHTSKLLMNCSLKKKIVEINRLNCKFMGGSIQGRGSVDLSRRTPHIDFSVQFRDVKVQHISNLSEKFKNRVFGIASGEADIKFILEKDYSIQNSLRGNMEFNIDKGKFVNTGIQNSLGIWLSELRYKLRDLEFNKIYGNFNISGQTYIINSFIFIAPDIRLKVDGYINRNLEGDIPINLEFNDNFIQDLPNPARLRLLQHKKGSWYQRKIQVKGDITDSKNYKILQ